MTNKTIKAVKKINEIKNGNMKDTELTKQIGQNIKELRRERELSVSDASQALGMSVSNWNYLEAGKIDITISRIKEVSELLMVDVIEILGYDINAICSHKTEKLKQEINKHTNTIIDLQQQLIIKERNNKLK